MSIRTPKCLFYFTFFFFLFLAKSFCGLPPNKPTVSLCSFFSLYLFFLAVKALIRGGPSSLKQQGGQQEQQQMTDAGLGGDPASNWAVVRCVGIESGSAPTTLTTNTHPTSWAANVITWAVVKKNNQINLKHFLI